MVLVERRPDRRPGLPFSP
uniref:Uncharacterized protein n=1 Tax=Arundo donax TaxID=35708 RepID=A0A0A9EDJ9_ARUDO